MCLPLRPAARALCLALSVLVVPPPSTAQEAALTFEVVAQTEYDNDALKFSNLLFFSDSTLLVVADGGVFDLTPPYSGSWTLRFEGRFTNGPPFLTPEGILSYAKSRALSRRRLHLDERIPGCRHLRRTAPRRARWSGLPDRR